jgi:hypothetical protein
MPSVKLSVTVSCFGAEVPAERKTIDRAAKACGLHKVAGKGDKSFRDLGESVFQFVSLNRGCSPYR